MEEHGITKNLQPWWFVLSTKTMINAGFVIASFVPLVLYWICGEKKLQMICSVLLGLGVIPTSVAFFCEAIWDNSMHVYGHHSPAKAVPYWLTLRWYWKSILGLSVAWFIYDFTMYVHFGIYSSMITNNITGSKSSLSMVLGWSGVINLFCIAGTVIGTFLIDYLGLKTTMIVGLLLQAAIGFIMGANYNPLTTHISTFAVSLTGFIIHYHEIGPGSCLYVLAEKSGPETVKRQFSVIAAAIGKVGAFVGQWCMFVYLDFGGSNTTKGNTAPFWISSGLGILSAAMTLLLVKPFTHNNMESEEKAFHLYLEENGFDVSCMNIGQQAGGDG
ncbi:major facilitator superfamily domain-containing protein [Pisolithus marmoratus]|nr:major facilitator superfamily domain-containing protein [Pisolithus marmoratus]